MNLVPPLFSVVPRSRASAALLAAAVVMAAVATTLVAAVPTYSDAIVEAGVRSTLADAPPAEAGVEVAFRAAAASWPGTVDRLARIATDEFPGTLDTVIVARTDTYALTPGVGPDGAITSLAAVAADADLMRTVAGPVPRSEPDAIAGRLHADAASALGVGLGDTLTVARSREDAITIELVELVSPIDPLDPRWFDQPLVRDGVTTRGSFVEIGPILVDAADLAAIGGTANFRWRASVDPDSVVSGDLDELRRAAAAIGETVAARLDLIDVDVTTGLPELVRTADTAIGSTAAVIAAILLQLVGVALYGVGLSASVLASSRAVETSMLRSRGATARQLGAMAAAEAALVAGPAVVLGPTLATRVVELVERWGPVASTGLDLRPATSTTSVVAAVVVGLLVVATVTWPAVRSAQGFAGVQAARARPEGPLPVQRAGLDVGVAALAVLGLWQLRGASASTSDLAGRLGTDPVLVVAPTLGVIAASLLTLRVISAFAVGTQRLTAAHGRLAWALAGWELARRPGRTARTSVLIVLSVTVGTFAAVHGASWQRSLRDQADATVSADAIVIPDGTPSAAVEAAHLPAAYRQLDGVAAVVPVDVAPGDLGGGLGRVPVVAADTAGLAEVLRLRGDLRVAPVDRYAALADPPELGGVALGEVTGDLVVDYALERGGTQLGGSLRPAALVVDAYGSLVRVEGERVDPTASAGSIRFPFTVDDPDGRRTLSGPLRLVELEIVAPAVQQLDPAGVDPPAPDPATYRITLSGARMGERPVELAADWEPTSLGLGSALLAPAVSVTSDGSATTVRMETGRSQQASAVVTARFGTSELEMGSPSEIPALVTPDLLAATGLDVGAPLAGRVTGGAVEMRIVGVVPVVPFAVDEPLAVLVDWGTLGADRWVRTRRIEAPDRWAMTVAEPFAATTGRVLTALPFGSVDYVERRELARDIAGEPVTVGLSGSLGLALAASLVIAAIGLVLTAIVGARERRPAFAVLRAMGARVAELRRWLLLETVPLVGLSAGVGIVAGVALARLALPSLAVGTDGRRAVPSPVLVVPWGTLAIIVAIAVAAGMALPVATARLLRRHRTADELRIGDTT